MAMQMIDWHEFAVVETINFDEGQDYMLPRSATHSELRQRYGKRPPSPFFFPLLFCFGRRRRSCITDIHQLD